MYQLYDFEFDVVQLGDEVLEHLKKRTGVFESESIKNSLPLFSPSNNKLVDLWHHTKCSEQEMAIYKTNPDSHSFSTIDQKVVVTGKATSACTEIMKFTQTTSFQAYEAVALKRGHFIHRGIKMAIGKIQCLCHMYMRNLLLVAIESVTGEKPINLEDEKIFDFVSSSKHHFRCIVFQPQPPSLSITMTKSLEDVVFTISRKIGFMVVVDPVPEEQDHGYHMFHVKHEESALA